MLHARKDYNRFQDPENKIPVDEPVFLLRGQDKFAPALLLRWASELRLSSGNPEMASMVEEHAQKMIEWQKNVKVKLPDINFDNTTFAKPEIKVDSYESACEYLEIGHNFACCPPNNKHHKAMVALFKLVTIAEAWNKEDDFVPDFSNRNQYKYFPWFKYNDDTAGFVCADASSTAAGAGASVGSRLCFKTSDRARQFGVQFIDLWNDFLFSNNN